MADPTYLIVARVHAVAARSDELVGAALQLARACREGDTGCTGYDVLVQAGARDELVLMSAWRDEAAMRAHFRSEAYGTYVGAVTDLLARPSDVTIHRVASVVHALADLSIEPGRAS